MTEPARAEVHADPDVAVLVVKEVDVMVACPDGAELRRRSARQRALRHELRVADGIEHHVIHRRRGGAAHAEGDGGNDLVHHPREVGTQLVDGQIQADGGVAAADVVANSSR